MRDVTEVFEHYRLTVRELWNRAIWSDPDLRWMSNVPGIFEKIRESLFEILVLEKLAVSDKRLAKGEPWKNRFRVVPNTEFMGASYRVATLRTLTRRQGGGIDGGAKIQIRDSEVTLLFSEFFNWSNMCYLDLSLVLVAIQDFPSRPQLIRTEGLIELSQVAIFLTDDTQTIIGV